jgi:acetyltransferase
MQAMIDYARAEGLQVIEGQILQENKTMLTMCSELGFEVGPDPNDVDIRVVRLRLPGRDASMTT